MGRDKSRLRLGGTSLVERAIACLREVAGEVLVADRGYTASERTASEYTASEYTASECRSIPDGPGAGPAAGILGAAVARPDHDLLVLACDLPEVPMALLRHLADPIEEDVHLPRWSRGIEPLCALYRPAVLAHMSAEVQAGRLALHAMLRQQRLKVRYLEGRRLDAFGPPERLFLNLNTPEDLEQLARLRDTPALRRRG